MKKITIDIEGMHCHSCELLIEQELAKIGNIRKIIIDQGKGTAEIQYEGQLDSQEIEKAVICAGYCLGKDEKPLISKNPRDWQDLAKAGIILLFLFLVVRELGLFNLSFTNSSNYYSLPVVLLIGLTAGVSTCMALVGGLVLGASARFAEKHPAASTVQKFKPHLYFNLGRIISYVIFGGVIGYAGSFFQLSTTFYGFLIIIAGMVMLLLGTQLIEIFPFIKNVTFTLPKAFGRFIPDKDQHPAVLGAATFFIPCGFTQAMQLFAVSSGSALTGALTLGVFALGTAPGLLGIGGLTSIVKGAIARLFFKTAGIIVIILAIFNISSGYNLTGLDIGRQLYEVFGPPTISSANIANMQNGFQIIKMDQTSRGYNPDSFTIKKGIPVRWIINSRDPRSCAASIVVPKLNIRKILDPGENIIEFTPTEIGTIKFTCSMGMYGGIFNVKN
ncbi:MAG: sulfite exporter TauE/SafE family protein [Patescibacteria group bacterium]